MSVPMTLEEARRIINDAAGERDSYADRVEAAAVIAKSSCNGFKDLIDCLRLGGLPAETAAMALYSRTGRHFSGDIRDFVTDPEEWTQFLELRNDPPRTFLRTNRWGVAA